MKERNNVCCLFSVISTFPLAFFILKGGAEGARIEGQEQFSPARVCAALFVNLFGGDQSEEQSIRLYHGERKGGKGRKEERRGGKEER